MTDVSRPRFEDGVSEVLAAYKVEPETVQEVRVTLVKWFGRHPSTEPLYLVLGDGTRTAREMADEIKKGTDIGISYVETFIAGALRNKKLGLERSLEALRSDL